MFANTFTVSLLAVALLATTCNAHPQPQPQAHATSVFAKRCGGCGYGGYRVLGGYGGIGVLGGYGGYGGYGGFSFPFVSSVTNDVDANANFANFNENTLYANNVNANAASDNIHAFNNANVIA
ncbi:hypothetical protein H4S07_006830 [Coemansia furcata]|uniref:Uncharacterized protein n=1 Tax=Coemansia furcata TaxID=417177 RepID=A0ACC1KSC1_9FUNG|nr:hypothetical protein H4S07_006830 [Coemansia furcata]